MYALFAGYNYYPEGGMNDCQLEGHTKQQVIDCIKKEFIKWDWWHIVQIDQLGIAIVADQNGYHQTLEDFENDPEY